METEKPDLKTGKNIIGQGKAGPGRPKGLRNKATRDIKELAQPYGPECIEGLAKLMKHKNPGIRLAACKEMLDWGYGKAVQAQPTEANEKAITVEIVQFSDLERELLPSPPIDWSPAD